MSKGAGRFVGVLVLVAVGCPAAAAGGSAPAASAPPASAVASAAPLSDPVPIPIVRPSEPGPIPMPVVEPIEPGPVPMPHAQLPLQGSTLVPTCKPRYGRLAPCPLPPPQVPRPR
jgi:hypothetical protein